MSKKIIAYQASVIMDDGCSLHTIEEQVVVSTRLSQLSVLSYVFKRASGILLRSGYLNDSSRSLRIKLVPVTYNPLNLPIA